MDIHTILAILAKTLLMVLKQLFASRESEPMAHHCLTVVLFQALLLCGRGHEGKTFHMDGSHVEFYFTTDFSVFNQGFVITVTFNGNIQRHCRKLLFLEGAHF